MFVRLSKFAAESIRLRIKRIAGFVVMPLRLFDLLQNEKFLIKFTSKWHSTYASFSFCSFMLFPRIILMCVSLAKWSELTDVKLLQFAIALSSCGELKSLLGECGGDA